MLAIHDDVFSEDGVQRDVSSSILQLALADIDEEDLRHLRAKHDALILLALCAVYDGGCVTRTIYLIGCTTQVSSYKPGAYTYYRKESYKYAREGMVFRRAGSFSHFFSCGMHEVRSQQVFGAAYVAASAGRMLLGEAEALRPYQVVWLMAKGGGGKSGGGGKGGGGKGGGSGKRSPNWPSKTGNPSGPNRDNNPPRRGK